MAGNLNRYSSREGSASDFRSKFSLVSAYLFAATFSFIVVAVFLYRAKEIDKTASAVISCDGCFYWKVIANDLPILAGIFFLLFLAKISRSYFLRLVLHVASAAVLFAYAVDLVIFKQFSTRLYFDDIHKFSAKIGPLLEQAAKTLDGTVALVFTLLAGALVLGFILVHRPTHPRLRAVWTVAVGILLMFSFLPKGSTYVHAWRYQNFVSVNMGNDQDVPYSREYIQRLQSAFEKPALACEQGLNQKRNIVLLVVESLSSYQSALLQGFDNWVPGIDSIAAENAYFTNFVANNFNTNPGLANMFTGNYFILPTEAAKYKSALATAWGNEQTVPTRLGEAGYKTVFLTSGDLSFARKREWLEHIGFDVVEGNEYPGYEGKPRTAFQAVSDGVLFDRTLLMLSELAQSEAPYFLAIETVTTHQPYIHPETRQRSIESVFRYTDGEVLRFYGQLKKRGFFDDGMLIITSDHRSMTPVSSSEYEKWGLRAPAMIPLIVAGAGDLIPRGPIDAPLQQTDLLTSLAYLVDDEVCFDGNRGNIFKPDKSERMRFHSRGDLRDHVYVYLGEAEGDVRLSGNETDFVEVSGMDRARQEAILRFMNYERIKGDARQYAYFSGQGR